MNQLVSVIMAAYNEPLQYVKEAIDSILNQTYQQLELIIVVDNPENLELITFLQSICRNDPRVVLLKNDNNIGLARSLNRAIKNARGALLARMDADDISFPERLKTEVEYLENHEEVSMVCTARINIDAEGKPMKTICFIPRSDEKLMNSLSYGSIITHPSVMIRKEAMSEVSGYNNYPCAQDYDLWIRLRKAKKHIHFMRQPLLYYRIHGSNDTPEKKLKQWLCTSFARMNLSTGKPFSREELDTYISSKMEGGDLLKRFRMLQQGKTQSGMRKINYIFRSMRSAECRKNILFSVVNRKNIQPEEVNLPTQEQPANCCSPVR